MRLILILSIAILCVGCSGTRTRLNPGAELGLFIGSTQWMHNRIPPGNLRAYAQLNGYYDPATGDITISEQARGIGWVQVWSDELQHAYAHQQPADLITLLRKYESDTFKLIAHGEEEIAILNALCTTMPPPDPQAQPSR